MLLFMAVDKSPLLRHNQASNKALKNDKSFELI